MALTKQIETEIIRITPATSHGEVITGDLPLDQIVIDQLPAGTKVLSCDRHGESHWTITARITTALKNGTTKLYFVKYAAGEQGKAMLEGEFHSMTALYNTSPTFVPRPLARGHLNVSGPGIYYFLCDFIEMTHTLPDPILLATKLAQLHKTSISPTGQFGFHITTCQGNEPQDTTWNSTWQDYFAQMLRGALKLALKSHPELIHLPVVTNHLITHIIPPILSPLTANNHTIKPSLIHGDLWAGNVGTEIATGEIYIFDASVYYAHHEMEIGMWRGPGGKWLGGKEYQEAYLEAMGGASEPREMVEDRLELYVVFTTMHAVACHEGGTFREHQKRCYEALLRLIDKFAPLPEAHELLKLPVLSTSPSESILSSPISNSAAEQKTLSQDQDSFQNDSQDSSSATTPPSLELMKDSNLNSIAMPPALPPIPYSTFIKSQKRLIVFLIMFAATFSPLSSFIFFPAIDALSTSLHTSISKINLTITSYMIIAGIAPAVIGDMADMTGRRIVYILTMAIYCIANIGLALQSSWIALFLLRMVQSAGGAATIAIGYGVVSDIAMPAERGGFVGIVLLGPSFATAIGPVLGGALAQRPGWRWIFWVLSIASGLCLILILFFLPETSRFIVGNGSQKVSGLHRTLYSYLSSAKTNNVPSKEQEKLVKPKFRIPNPLTSLKLLWAKDMAVITSINGIYYMNFSCLQASMSTLFIKIYGLSELEGGLIYLPFGVGACLAAYFSGKIMNRDYRITARENNIEINVISGDDLTDFPIEKARLRSMWISVCVSSACTIGYGWSLHSRAHMALPLIIQFFAGLSIGIILNTCGTIIVDLHPKSPAAAQAANNIVRCSLAGGGLAILQLFLDKMGSGWTFTLLGALCMCCQGLSWLEQRYGRGWRKEMLGRGIER